MAEGRPPARRADVIVIGAGIAGASVAAELAPRRRVLLLDMEGGYGIQTAPALARLAAAQVLGEPVPADIAAEGVSARDLSPARLVG
jgi:glycine/D-amino acid oxidase-like deaminating enzyme